MARPEGSPSTRLRLLLATGFGVGYAPVVPGTFGSLPGLLLAWLAGMSGGPWALAVALILVIPLGLWAAGPAEAHFGRSDPRPVVIDEIAGQMLALLFIAPTLQTLLASFVLFRIFDVLKPFPGRQLESLPGAAGIMADDLAAGLYANGALRLLSWAFALGWAGA